MINLVIPMAGLGSRFETAGYTVPKPFIDVNGMPMIEVVVNNLYRPYMNLILLVRDIHLNKYKIILDKLKEKYKATVIVIDKVTEGIACTVLYAKKIIDNNFPLIIANSDQFVEFDIDNYISDVQDKNLDGSILCFKDYEKNPKWSFVEIDSDNIVIRVREKEPISEYATVGIYFFSSGKNFISAAMDMIGRHDKVNGEYYTCPVYNYLIQDGYKIGVFFVDANDMYGLGTPQDLRKYLEMY